MSQPGQPPEEQEAQSSPKAAQPSKAQAPEAGEAFERAEKALEAVNEATGTVRNLYLTFLLLGTYIGVIIASTTDEQLLRISPVTLPLLDVELPILRFYAVIPWLFLLLHFNLLYQFALLGGKLHWFNDAANRLPESESAIVLRRRLVNFPLVYLLSGQEADRFMRLVSILIIWITVILLPLWLLLWAQIAFLPYHDPIITWGHRAAVLLDAVILVLFWGRIVSLPGITAGRRGYLRRGCTWLVWLLAWPWAVIRSAWKWRWIPPSGRESGRHRQAGASSGAGFLAVAVLITAFMSFTVATVPGEWWETRILLGQLPESWTTEIEGRSERRAFWPTYVLFESSGALFHRNLNLREKVLTANNLPAKVINALREGDAKQKEMALQEIRRISLQGRDLRYAQLFSAILPKADLRGADLQGADLYRADLQGAVLEEADLQGAVLVGADLQGAVLVGADLQGADLRGADLQGAVLVGADLQGAVLNEADLQGADLYRADLQGAVLEEADLQGAVLEEADLQGAVLVGADLQGAVLVGADLQGADLRGADLQGAVLVGANLQGADLRGADLQGAVLVGANLQGADLIKANLQGADLIKADLQGAVLRGANLQGADLIKANLQGVNLDEADLQGADLIKANLQGAVLRGANLQGADLIKANLQGVNLDEADLQGAVLREAFIGGANFGNAHLGLADLRDLNRDVLTEEQYLKISEDLEGEVDDAKIRATILDRIKAAIGREVTLNQAIEPEEDKPCLSDTPKPFANCLTEDQSDQYDKVLVPYLVEELACGNPYVAYGVAGRVIWWEKRTNLKMVLAKALLKADCAAVKDLPEHAKKRLREIVERPPS